MPASAIDSIDDRRIARFLRREISTWGPCSIGAGDARKIEIGRPVQHGLRCDSDVPADRGELEVACPGMPAATKKEPEVDALRLFRNVEHDLTPRPFARPAQHAVLCPLLHVVEGEDSFGDAVDAHPNGFRAADVLALSSARKRSR